MLCLELPYHPEIPSLTLLAIMLNVLDAAHSLPQCNESIYWQHKYSADTVIQAVLILFFFWLAFLLIWVIRLSGFDTCLMDKGYFHWIVHES